MTTTLKTRPLHKTLATQIEHHIMDVCADDALFEQLQKQWQKTPVIVFRRQFLSERDQVEFSSRFGECVEIHRKDNVSPYESKIVYFSTLRYADGRFVGAFSNGEEAGWHSDQTYTPNPATGALLYGVEVPRDSGAMYWADQYGAYELLSDELKQAIQDRVGVFRYGKYIESSEMKGREKEVLAMPDGLHEIVITHPLTGRKALYVDPTRLVEVQGWSREENERFLPQLFKAASDESLVYGHKTMSGDVLLWDNGLTMHRRDAITMEQPRIMKRSTFRLPAAKHGLPSGAVKAQAKATA